MKQLLLAVFVLLFAAVASVRVRGGELPNTPATAALTNETIREFHAGVAAGDQRLVEDMLRDRPDLISAPLPEDDSAKRVEPLFTAIDHVQASMMQLLLKHGANYVRGASGQTPLDRATLIGDVETVKILLDAGANADGLDDPANGNDLENPTHGTPLRDAVVCGHPEIARFLVQRGAHVDLYSAAGMGWTDWVSRGIAEHPEQTDLADGWGYTPLCYALGGSCASTAEILLQHGADVSHVYSDNGTLLHLAVNKGDHALIEVLLANGASINAKNNAGETAVDYAIKYRQQDAEQLLRQHGGKRASELN